MLVCEMFCKSVLFQEKFRFMPYGNIKPFIQDSMTLALRMHAVKQKL